MSTRAHAAHIAVVVFLSMAAWSVMAFEGLESRVHPALRRAVEKLDQGALLIGGGEGAIDCCPLQHTDVQVEISGFIARVRVTQVFRNPFDHPIEAVYVFPLPHGSAVDGMTMLIGERRVVGAVKERKEAREIYREAIRKGQTASLLEQERPNVFTQSVAHIQPKEQVRVEISYVDVLTYDLGVYEFHFPMVVGPRCNPGVSRDGIGAVPHGEEGFLGQPVEVAYLKPRANGAVTTLRSP